MNEEPKVGQPLTPDAALALYPQTCVLLLLSCPKGIKVGIDNMMWDVGEMFKGFKLVPEGAHYISYSLREEMHKFKMGFFFFAKKGEVIVKQWNSQLDTFADVLDFEEANRKLSL